MNPIAKIFFVEQRVKYHLPERYKQVNKTRGGFDSTVKEKKCYNCGETKLINDFSFKLNTKDGFRKECRKCHLLSNQKRNEEIKLIPKNRIIKEQICSSCQENKTIDNFYITETFKTGYTQRCKQCNRKISVRKPETKIKRNTQLKEKRINDFKFRITENVKNVFKQAIKKTTKINKTKSFKKYGIDINSIIEHIGECPQDGKIYHIDHIFPVKAFDLTNELDIKICWHFSNLRWLEASQNLKKSATYNEKEFEIFYEETKLLL